ncbi:hypothetical protein PF006_g14530 [Phytophthora fragariae]|uniref:Uncharacterized protein n=1 Tax=Phytophthora fragariae TaxID=53985 RepID=A0A6A3TEV6_9STRA|nr:hypothetical protein PF003_g16941 [Phytophthora fragariae]KAE8999678.1 hypothetical protein PF011_g14530 [Phytophthora fragariae]KAE9135757.1 hypothetical protein PF006_g14530 [Phytophthora fragariae]
MREPAETPSEPPQFQPLLPPQFQPLLPPQFQPSALELVRPPFFEPPPDDAAQQHAEETAIASLIEERTPHVLKEKLQDLEAVQAEFARVFKAKYSGYCPSKLPLLFIVRGEPNGTIEREKLPTYPEDHVYTVQS